jgi:hypothetical protein
MKVFIKKHHAHAGFWIYQGYYEAWKSMGYDTNFYDNLEEIGDEKDYYLMALDFDLKYKNIKFLENSKKTFLFVQPNVFPRPWGTHPNYISNCQPNIISIINEMNNVLQWTFSDVKKEFFTLWSNPKTIPLAFDSQRYKPSSYEEKYDVCYIGGRANNGFDEKYHIIMNTFSEFMGSNLKCAFFVGKNLTHQQEQDILSKSKVGINIHDAYQRKLSLDTNERTFKTLGLTGIMVSDFNKQIDRLLKDIDVPMSLEPKNIKTYVEEVLDLSTSIRKEAKEKNRNIIADKHTYKNRITKMLETEP